MNPLLASLWAWCRVHEKKKAPIRIRVKSLLEHWSHFIQFPIIKITGTNGKGSTSAMLAACLHADGKKVGSFHSPHLVSENERIRINGKNIPMQQMEAHAIRIQKELEFYLDEKGKAYAPSFFEVLMLIALSVFAEEKVEIAIFEAGVGGKNDATHLLADILSVITSIGLDHKRQLGNTKEAIAADKAGIAQEGSRLVLASRIPPNLVQHIQAHTAANAVIQADDLVEVKESGREGSWVKVSYLDEAIHIPLVGDFQLENFRTVLAIWKELMEMEEVQSWGALKGVGKTQWGGRMEFLQGSPNWLFDIAHNEQALTALLQSVQKHWNKDELILVFGTSEEKDYTNFIHLLPQFSNRIVLMDGFYKAVPKNKLQQALIQINPHIPIQAFSLSELSEQFDAETTILVTGSAFLVGEVKAKSFS